MSNSSLVSYTNISPNKTSPRNHIIDTITIHCFVGQVNVKNGVDCFKKASKKASCNYVVAKDGQIGLVVDESDRSWCSSNSANDNRAITIEVASDTKAPYAITNEAMIGLIKLCADICKRNNIAKLVWSDIKNDRVNHNNGCNMTCHRDFAKKSCPGDYIYAREGHIAEEVNKLLTNSVEKTNENIDKETFIKNIAYYVNKYRKKYDIKVASPIIAQACLESAYGTSELAKRHNYFGLKYREGRCPTSDGFYAKAGSEQNADGSYMTSTMTWFKFPDMESGVIGYFDFTNISNYIELKKATTPREYLESIKKAGYATSIKYVDNVMAVVNKWNLTQYDVEVADIIEGNEVYYVIQKGDSLNKIASKYGTTAKAIQSLNPDKIKNINLIQVGWKIKVK